MHTVQIQIAKRRPLVPVPLNQDVQNLALTINCAPQIHQFAAYVRENLIQVPLIKCSQVALANPAGMGSSEFQHPQTNCFVAEVDTNLPASEKSIIRSPAPRSRFDRPLPTGGILRCHATWP